MFPRLPSLGVRGGILGFSGVSAIAFFRGSWGFMDFRGLPEITLLRGSGGV